MLLMSRERVGSGERVVTMARLEALSLPIIRVLLIIFKAVRFVPPFQ